jgi:hypothetical protein
MFLGVFQRLTSAPACREGFRLAVWMAAMAALCGASSAWGQSVAKKSKHTIGATAKLTELESGFTFAARVDTGAQSCSLHIEEFEIKNRDDRRTRNIGKTIRFRLKDSDGKSAWVETKIVEAVRVKSSVLKSGEYDHRYKVRLTLRWNDFEKEVLVTLNDRTDMEFPLLIGRNYLRDDFLVDVAKKN